MMRTVKRLAWAARGIEQELRVRADDLRYSLLNRGDVLGRTHRIGELPSEAARRWYGWWDAPFHVLYVGQPWNWEEHNLPQDPGLSGVVSTLWLRDLGFVDYANGAIKGRERVGEALIEHVRRLRQARPVHLVLAYLSGAQILERHVRQLAREGVMTAGFHFDDRLYFRGRLLEGQYEGPAALAGAWDLNLTNVRSSLVKYAVAGGRAMFWPEGANPAFFKPSNGAKTHDVSFVGGMYGPRQGIVEHLRNAGLSVLTHGPGWPEGEVEAERVPEILNRGRLALGFSGIGRSLRVACLKGRDFEATLCGCAYLPSFNPELQLVYEEGREIVSWHSPRQLVKTARTLLGDEPRLAALRMAARTRALREHTWAARVESLARVLGHPWRAVLPEEA